MPRLALDGSDAEGMEEAVRIVYGQAGDQWASAEFRSEVAVVLARRCLDELNSKE